MRNPLFSFRNSRRDFIKNAFAAFCLASLKPSGLLAKSQRGDERKESPDFIYKYGAMSVRHFGELQEWMDKLDREGKLSDNKTYRSYIDNKKFKVPDDFPEAKSIIILARFYRLMFVNFELNGKMHELMIPPQYYDDGLAMEDLEGTVKKKIVKKPGYRVERVKKMFMKPLAVRSGLARYGRNNITYVEGMGSFLALSAFFTDYEFEKDNWNELRMMDSCKTCGICMGRCPNKCITGKNFVIDAGRCLSLYNEVAGEFPDWIAPGAHNSLVGCMRCQLECPGNREAVKLSGRLEDVTEEETRKVLEGKPDEKLIESLNGKLKGYYLTTSKEYFPIFTRNLKVLIG